MTEREKIEVLRTLRVIARNASNEIRQDCLEVVKGLIGGLSLLLLGMTLYLWKKNTRTGESYEF